MTQGTAPGFAPAPNQAPTAIRVGDVFTKARNTFVARWATYCGIMAIGYGFKSSALGNPIQPEKSEDQIAQAMKKGETAAKAADTQNSTFDIKKTAVQTTTTEVRIAVARFGSTWATPTLASNAVAAANRAERTAQKSQVMKIPWLQFTSRPIIRAEVTSWQRIFAYCAGQKRVWRR